MELFRGINQIKIPLPKTRMESVNVYIIEGNSGNLMIDTGWNSPDAFNFLAQEMKSSGFAMNDITEVVITHLHPDHFGLAGKISELSGAKIYMSQIDASLIDSRYFHPEPLLNEMSGFLKSNGLPDWELKMITEASADIRQFISPLSSTTGLNPGDKITMDPFEFQVILTPGHTAGHICLYEPNKKYLFSGDHILAEMVPNVSYHPQSGENPVGDYVNSLNVLAELEIRFVFPGHGSVFSGLAPKIDDILRMHRDRISSIQKVMGVTTQNGYDIARSLSWIGNDGMVAYDKLEPINRRLALLDVLAHLQLMVAEKKGKKIVEDSTILYFSGE